MNQIYCSDRLSRTRGGSGVKRVNGVFIILASCNHHFIIVHRVNNGQCILAYHWSSVLYYIIFLRHYKLLQLNFDSYRHPNNKQDLYITFALNILILIYRTYVELNGNVVVLH